jgi:hypothetical protein
MRCTNIIYLQTITHHKLLKNQIDKGLFFALTMFFKSHHLSHRRYRRIGHIVASGLAFGQ